MKNEDLHWFIFRLVDLYILDNEIFQFFFPDNGSLIKSVFLFVNKFELYFQLGVEFHSSLIKHESYVYTKSLRHIQTMFFSFMSGMLYLHKDLYLEFPIVLCLI